MPDFQQFMQVPWLMLLLLFFCLYVLFCALAAIYAEKLLFPVPMPPACAAEQVDFFVTTESGTKIACVRRSPAQEGNGPVILYSHGNGEDLGHLIPFLEETSERGFEIVAYDYPGYGVSEGKPSESGCYEAIDATYQYLINELNIEPARIIVWGRSLGSGPSCYLASRVTIGGLILETPFLSAFRTVTEIPVLPWDRFRNTKRLESISCPSLVVHGEMDEVVPFRHGKKLYEGLPEPKSFLEIENASHNDFREIGGSKYESAISDFLDQFIRD
jgi:abhydrolase domain-containing protein 17